MPTRGLVGLLAAISAVLVTAGCGGGSAPGTGAGSSSSPPGGTSGTAAPQVHNAADVSFAQMMIPHHAQAIDMSALAPQRAASPQVKDLAARIAQAQGPEIQQMSDLLRAWGAAVPPTGSGMGGMDMPGMGMMSPAQMAQLGQASGRDFDRMFLQMMIQHHQGAIMMSQTELRDGQNPEAKQLAQRIIDSQQREITEMQGLLQQV